VSKFLLFLREFGNSIRDIWTSKKYSGNFSFPPSHTHTKTAFVSYGYDPQLQKLCKTRLNFNEMNDIVSRAKW